MYVYNSVNTEKPRGRVYTYITITYILDVQIQFLERNVYVQNGTDTVELGLNTNIRLDFNVTIDCNSERICKSLYKYFALNKMW